MWLARLKGEEKRDKIYALKILRKADGKEAHATFYVFYWIMLTERVATLQSSNYDKLSMSSANGRHSPPLPATLL